MDSRRPALLPVVAGMSVVAAIALLAVLVATGWPTDQPGGVPDAPPSGSRRPFSDPPEPLNVPDCERANQPLARGSLQPVSTLGVPMSTQPGWLAYLPSARTLLLPNIELETMTSLSLFGDVAGQWPLPIEGAEQATVVDTPEGSALGTMVSDPSEIALASLPYGDPALSSEVGRIDLRALDLTDVLALDAAAGDLALVDGGRRLVRARMAFDRVGSACQVRAAAGVTFRAVATRERDGHVFLLASGADGARLVELDVNGAEVADFALSGNLARATAMVFAPIARAPTDAAVEHLYLLTSARQGPVIRVVAVEPDEWLPGDPVVSPEHVRTTNTGSWNPPSSDPTGVEYDIVRGTLIVTDSEVDERGSEVDTNVWVVALDGDVRETLAFSPSTEVTDVAIDPVRRRTFLADDGQKMIHVWEPGADGLLGTPDDRTSRFSTISLGSEDPEGLAFGQGSLFIADGAGRRVVRLTPGPNGIFEGIHSRSDDEVTTFDVGRLGLTDPEGIAYRPETGTLLVLDREDAGPVLELTTAGNLVRRFDLVGHGLRSPSGLVIGPSSDDPDRQSFYVVDRGAKQLVEFRLPDA